MVRSPSGLAPARPEGPQDIEFKKEVYSARTHICPIIPAMLELLIIVVVLLLVFGAGKVRNAGSDLGAAVRGFRKSLQAPPTPPPAAATKAGAPDSAAAAGETLPDAEFPEV